MSTSAHPLPSWYYRLSPHLKSHGVVLPWKFDDDISDLDEARYNEASAYNGPDAEWFHQLREKREERKRELQKRVDFVQKQKEKNREDEEDKLREVQTAYQISEGAGHTTDLGELDTTFELYSLAYFDNLYDPCPVGNRKKYLRFENADEQNPNGLLMGVLWLNPDVKSELVPFYPPTHSSLKHYRLDTIDGRYALIVQFIDGNHLVLRVSRDLVFMDRPHQAIGPDTFLFGGVRNDWGKQLQAYAKSFHGRGCGFSFDTAG